jgi:tripartite-type tricarboxylate transporter receptor subunit TctC
MVGSLLLTRRVLAAALLGAVMMPGSGYAQDYPQRVITIVVPYVAGGPTDAAIRVVTQRMGAVLGQQLILENVGGAGGTTGTMRVARAAPDGYTLLAQQTGIATIPGLYPQLPIDVTKDLTPIAMVNRNYSFLVGRKTLPANTLAELKAWMQGPGKPAKFAHPGVGSAGHINAVVTAKALDASVTLIPYRGGAPAMNDLVAGHVDVLWAASTLAVEQISAGAIKPFAVGSGKPPNILPNVPSVQDVGLPQMDNVFWQALYAPAGTPEPIIRKLNAALREALASPEVQKAYADTGASTYPVEQQTPEFASAVLKQEVERITAVIRENNIKVGQ